MGESLSNSGLLLGVLLLAAIAGGYVAHRFGIPRVVGYLLAGAGVRVLFSALPETITPDPTTLSQAEKVLEPVKALALGLILFTIGGVFDIRHIKGIGRTIMSVGLTTAGVTLGLVFICVLMAGWVFAVPVSGVTLIAFSLLLGLASLTTAPAATLFTLREYGAKGPVSDMVLSVTGLSVVLCLVGFNVVFLLLGGLGWLDGVTISMSQAWVGIGWVVVGSTVLGVGLGFVCAVTHGKLRPTETVMILLAVLIVLSSGKDWLMHRMGVSYSALLAAMIFGMVFANIATDPDGLTNLIETIGPPLYVSLFAMAGFQLHMSDLKDLSGIGIAYIVARTVGKLLGCWIAAKRGGRGGGLNPWIGTGLLCQATVVVSLVDFVGTHWGNEWARRSFMTTLLGSAVVFEIAGPLLIKWLVVRCGEVKAVTLLRHGGSSPDQSRSIVSLTAEALLRVLGLSRNPTTTDGDQPLRVRHLMRANVKCIPASAGYDEVLKLVEQSRYNHFPVIDERNRLVGVIHFNDLSQIIYDPMLYQLVTAEDLSNNDLRSVTEDASLDEVFELFQNSGVASLPVVTDSESLRVVGIIEQRDLLRTLGPGTEGGGH